MLKIINGLIDADSGRFTLGSKVQIGYYDQEHHVLHMEKTIFEEISDAYPTLTETEIEICWQHSFSQGMMYSN